MMKKSTSSLVIWVQHTLNTCSDGDVLDAWHEWPRGTWSIGSNRFKAAAYNNVLSTGKLGHANTSGLIL